MNRSLVMSFCRSHCFTYTLDTILLDAAYNVRADMPLTPFTCMDTVRVIQ